MFTSFQTQIQTQQICQIDGLLKFGSFLPVLKIRKQKLDNSSPRCY